MVVGGVAVALIAALGVLAVRGKLARRPGTAPELLRAGADVGEHDPHRAARKAQGDTAWMRPPL
jgi:hypothetical protein